MVKGKVHLIEVLPDSSEEDELEQKPNGELHSTELEQLPQRATIATLTEVPTFLLSGSREVSRIACHCFD